ncbi:MAG: hypothetical protein A2086_08395 [Spirochaetes bacterium GWD1_27_9]|nr:MAG: hypothetical protein A2Y34_12670 [Spirochaetes bacterium GWC1_27_15]OHD30601.1 MAG: hypothetical protein A2086_08395 [Spirochaetes bacterium GWD1_27_9]
MENNDLLRRLRYLVNMNENLMADTIELTGTSSNPDMLIAMLKQKDEAGYTVCPPKVISDFLDGLIIKKRGKSEDKSKLVIKPPIVPLTNNLILKKLRIAYELRDDDIIAIFAMDKTYLSKSEVNALFRQPDHRNFKECKDQFLKSFIKGLSLWLHRKMGVD